MAGISTVLGRVRSFRSSALEIAYLCALLGFSFFARSQGAAIIAIEEPRIVAAEAELAALVSSLDTISDTVDPRVRALAEKKRDLEADLNRRLRFWTNVRVMCWIAFVIASLLGGARFVRHLFRRANGDDGRPPPIVTARQQSGKH